MKNFSRFIRSAVAFLLLVLIHTQIIFAADLQVDANSDNGTGSCELREAVNSVNNAADTDGCLHSGDNYGNADKITFTGAGVGTHTLNGTEISITAPVTIEGPAHLGTPSVTVDAGGASRIFDIDNPDGTTVTIRNLELTNGSASNGGLAFLHNGSVGNPKTLVLDKDDLRNGSASGDGGALHTGQNNDVTINGSELDNNSAANNGGAVYIDSGTTFNTDKTNYHDNTAVNNGGAIDLQTSSTTSTIDRAILQKNATTLGDGGAVHVSSGTANLMRSTVGETVVGDGNGNTSASEGGGVAADGTASLSLGFNNIVGNSATFAGGGLNFTASGAFTSDADAFLANVSTSSSGGGAHISGASSASFSTVNFGGPNPGEGNTANGVGGGLYVEDLDIGLFEMSIYGNSASADGGGVYFGNNALAKKTLTILGDEISNNDAGGNGGGIFMDNNTIANIQQVNFDGNHATNQAGALFMESAVDTATNADVTVQDSTFSNNTADTPLDFAGGAVHVGHWGDLTLDNISATGNSATAGGGGFLNGFSNVNVSILNPLSSFTGNQAAAGNGGVFRIQSGTLSLEGNYSGNSATTGGGVIYGAGDFSLNGLSVIQNSPVTFYSNTVTDPGANGGAINLARGSVTLTDAIFGAAGLGNTAPNGFGGAIYTQDATIDLTNPAFVENSADSGGAIYMDPQTVTTDLQINGGSFESNSSSVGSGGAICLSGVTGTSGSLIDAVTFTSNTSTLDGGAINGSNLASLTLSNDTFETNVTEFFGGAVNLDGTTINISDTNFNSNTANNKSGGAGRIQSTDLNLTDTNFDANQATNGNGGALSLSISSPFTIGGSYSFTSNYAGFNGGAIYTNSTDMSLDPGLFQLNSAGQDGGAIALNPGAGLGSSALHNTEVNYDQNSAGEDGGAIYCDNSGGTSICEIYYVGAELLNGFTNNTAVSTGGAIGGEILFFGVNSLIDIDNAIFDNNSAGFGSAIGMSLGSIIMNDVNITNNSASSQGTIRLGHDQIDDPDVDFQFSNLLVDNNTAPLGTGILVTDGTAQSALTINDSVFSNNHGEAAFTVNGSGPGMTATLNHVTFDSNNDTLAAYPAVLFINSGSLEINESTFSNNSGLASPFAGVIASSSQLNLNRSAIVDNTVRALLIADTTPPLAADSTIANNTFSGNIVDDMELMRFEAVDVNLFNNTIYNNIETAGGAGVFALITSYNNTTNFANNIIAGNTVGPETGSSSCMHLSDGSNISLGHNLIEDPTNCNMTLLASDLTGFVPPLAALALNGGTTLSHLLNANSSALDGGDDLLADVFDQRRERRPVGIASDIGSTDIEDTFNPNLSLITPVTPINPAATPLTFDFSSDENVSFFDVTGCPGAAVSLSLVSPYTATVTGLAPGDYTCDFSFADASGNYGTLPSQSFTITAPPTPPSGGGSGGSGGSAQFGQPPSQGGQPQLPTPPGQLPTPPSQPTQPTQPTVPPVNTPVTPPVVNSPTTPTKPTPASPAASGTNFQPAVTPTTTPTETPVDDTHQSAFTPGKTTSPFNFGNICKFDQFANQYNLPAIDSSTDFDRDGLSDKLECLVKTNPRQVDTDGDNYNDGREVLNLFTNPLIPNRGIQGGVEIITPEDELKSADETPYILGLAPANKETQVYLFEKADFDEISEKIIAELDAQTDLTPERKTLLYRQKLTEAIQDILAKFISNSLDRQNPLEAKFIDRIADLGSANSSDNGLFVLDSQKSIKDGTYLLMAVSGALFSNEKEMTIDQTLKVLTPTLSKFDNKPIPAEALLGNLRIEVSPGTQTPVLVGNIKESSRIVATWQSNIVSSALLADSLDEEFRLASPTPLAPGDHKVYITAYRQSDGAQSETLSLNFKLQPATPAADYSRYIYLGLAALLLIILLVLVRRRQNKSKDLPPSGPVTVSTPIEPKAPTSNATFTTMGSATPATPVTPSTPSSPTATTITENTVKTETAQPASSTPDMLSEIFGEDEAKKFDEKQK